MTKSELRRYRSQVGSHLAVAISVVRPYAASQNMWVLNAAAAMLDITRKQSNLDQESLALVELAAENVVATFRPRFALGQITAAIDYVAAATVADAAAALARDIRVVR